jgi:Flp pilus assembly protein TadG
MKRMRGVATVEFAIVGAVLMAVLFGCLEFGRATYTLAALNEGTRRAARLAAVCPINDGKIASAVNFAGLVGFNATVATGGNVNLQYLDVTGAALAGVPAASAVYFVQVGVTGYNIPLIIPGLNVTITSPSFTVTLRSESLGLSTDPVTGAGVVTAC